MRDMRYKEEEEDEEENNASRRWVISQVWRTRYIIRIHKKINKLMGIEKILLMDRRKEKRAKKMLLGVSQKEEY